MKIRPNDLTKLRVIKTARKLETINESIKHGFWPLVKQIKKSKKIKSKYKIIQNPKTGEVRILSDLRDGTSDWVTVINWTDYYPYSWENPFAAYLVPIDIREGEWVILEDLIEDFIGSTWNQGDVYRLDSCLARWINGDFDIDYQENHVTKTLG